MKTYYVGMDVHQASIVIVVLNGAGKVVETSSLKTGASAVRSYLQRLKGRVYVTFEEGAQAQWLYDLVQPLVTAVVVCDPRQNRLLAAGNKSDWIDAQKLAYVSNRKGGDWVEEQKLTASDGATGDFFGFSVAISGSTIVVSASGDDIDSIDQGSAYVFKP